MKTKFFAFLAVAAMIMACDKVNEETEPGLDFGDADEELQKPVDPVGDPLTPAESRVKLEQIGKDLSNILKPDSQKELLEVIDEFYVLAEDMEIEYRGHIEEATKTLLDPMREVATLNVKAAADYTSFHETFIFGLDQISGIYTHDGSKWSYTANAEKLEMNFKVKGQETTIVIVPSGESYEYEYTDEHYREEWNGSEYVKIPCKHTTKVRVPGKVEAGVTKGGKALANLLIEGEYKVPGQAPIYSNATLTMGSYNVKVSALLSTEKIQERILFTVDGQTVLNANAEAKGNFNLDPQYYLNTGDPDSYSAFIGIKNAEFVTKILDLRLAASCNDIQGVEKGYYDFEADVEKNENKTALEPGTPYSLSEPFINSVCNFFNEKITVEASYGDGPTFATLQLKAQYYDEIHYHDLCEKHEYDIDINGDGIPDGTDIYYSGQERYLPGYEPLPIIKFADDGGSFSIVEFFNEKDFANVITDYENLVELYKNCLPNIVEDNMPNPEYPM